MKANDWKEIRLKELIADMGDGATPSTYDNGNFGEGIPWVVVDDISDEIFQTKQSLTQKGFNRCSAKLWDPGTIILSTGATIGEVGTAKVRLCTKQGITGIACNEHADPDFIKYWLKQNKRLLLRFAQGTTFKEIRTRTLGNLRIKVPMPFTPDGLNEQKNISKNILLIDKAIKSTEDTVTKAEHFKRALMQNLLTGKLRPDGSVRNKDDFYQDDKFGRIPKGWKVFKLKEVVRGNLEYGANTSAIKYDKSRPRFIRITDIDDLGGLIDTNKVSCNVKNGKYKLIDNDFLFARTGDTVGKSLLYKKEMGECIFAGYLIKVQLDFDKILPEYFKVLALSDIFEAFKHSMKRVGAKPNINAREYGNFKFPLPLDIDEQKEVYKNFDLLFETIKVKKAKIKKLDRLKKSLMQNLLTGKVRLKVG